jgi:hypothetical protein
MTKPEDLGPTAIDKQRLHPAKIEPIPSQQFQLQIDICSIFVIL